MKRKLVSVLLCAAMAATTMAGAVTVFAGEDGIAYKQIKEIA